MIYTTHSLTTLWERCENSLSALDSAGWQTFQATHAPFIQALSDVDDVSANFRFPVDQKGTENERPQFIDLGALHRHVEAFQSAAFGWIDWIIESKSFQAEMVEDFPDEY